MNAGAKLVKLVEGFDTRDLKDAKACSPNCKYISEPLDLPKPTTIDQANQNIAYISDLKSKGQLDLDFADSLISDCQTVVHNLIVHARSWVKHE